MLPANTINTFTLYRTTIAFMDTLNSDTYNLNLHRMRSMISIGESYQREALECINLMLDKGYLIPAATVICKSEDLFRVTNTISRNWMLNEGVSIVSSEAFMSSTSLGDVFTDETGQFYVVGENDFLPFDRT